MTRIAENILTVLVAAAILLGLALEANAAAPAGGEARNTPFETVAFDDLNLTSGAGVKALERRVKRAAQKACGSPEVSRVGLARALANRRCADDAVAGTLARILEARIARLQRDMIDLPESFAEPPGHSSTYRTCLHLPRTCTPHTYSPGYHPRIPTVACRHKA